MAFHCMNCNGSMVFDVGTQKMRCLHCDSECDPNDFVFRDQGVGDGGMALFSCQNCGAELEGTEDSLIGFCPYCGGQSLVKTASEGSRVERILPFQITKDRCTELYRSYAKKVRYLPKELKDPEYIQKFTGIYMPFYRYDAEYGAVTLSGSKTVEHNRRYDVVNSYRIEGEVDGSYDGAVTFDGSRYLDDEISERSLPFDDGQEKPFNPAYLSGFYADASTVSPDLYYEDARNSAEDDMVEFIGKQVHANTGINMDSKSTVETNITGHHSVLLPMWFLTWRKEDRVAYAVINGQSGKVVSDLPLNLCSFAIGCAVFSAVLFVLLELFVQPTPMITSLISLAAAYLMARGIKLGAQREYEQQMHVNDKGWSGMESDDAITSKKKRRKKSRESTLSGIFAMVFFAVALFFVLIGEVADSSSFLSALRFVVPAIVLVYSVVVGVKMFRWRSFFTRKDPFVAIAVLLVSVVLNALILIVSPVNDGWYYIGDAMCIVGLVVAAVGMLRTYNLSTTRPLPKLFDRAEV